MEVSLPLFTHHNEALLNAQNAKFSTPVSAYRCKFESYLLKTLMQPPVVWRDTILRLRLSAVSGRHRLSKVFVVVV